MSTKHFYKKKRRIPMKKIKVHIDPIALTKKPTENEWGEISKRVFRKENIVTISVNDLVENLKAGHTICPAVMNGSHASDWQEQQVFMVDIDNADNTQSFLTKNNALEICDENDLTPAIYYQTFSYRKDHPKFRLVFITDHPVKDTAVRQKVIEKLVSIFPQSDRATTNANRLFLGTNQKVALHDENARISVDHVMSLSTSEESETQHSAKRNQAKTRNDRDLEKAIRDFDFLSYLTDRNGEYRESGNIVYFDNCEICGHKDDLRYFKDTKMFRCFSTNGDDGGTILKYLMLTENLSPAQARKKLIFELTDPWDQPKPLSNYNLPEFPVSCLPSFLQKWVVAVSESTQTPIDMAAVASLAAVATAVQGKYRVCKNNDYSEPLNLYILIIAKPAERKSAIISAMTDCIYRFEAEENQKRLTRIHAQEAQLHKLKRDLEKAKDIGKVTEIQAQIDEIEQHKEHNLRIIADDITPEALSSLLSQNNGILSIISAEGGLFDTLLGRYNNTPSIDILLKAHNQDRLRVDRKGSGSETIDNPTMTILLSAQPSILEKLFSEEIFRNRGLTARFLYCIPKSRMGKREYEPPEIPPTLKTSYNSLIHKLSEIPSSSEPAMLKLSGEAYDVLGTHHNWLEPQLAKSLEDMSDWAGKLAGATLRIAGILHCTKYTQKASVNDISEETMNNAIDLSKYFLAHAKYAYSSNGAIRDISEARKILKSLKRQANSELTPTEIQRLNRSISKVEDMEPSLGLLVDFGYIKPFWDGTKTAGRPKGLTYILNPKYFDIE
jgi:hypothetical protein